MEEWKQIENYENYEVSTEGNVRNKKTGRILKQCENGTGYLKVHIKTKYFLVHRLVLETFKPTDDKTLEVNHINENKHDNRLENLEWKSHKNNMQHGTRTERATKKTRKKVRCIETNTIYDSIRQASEELNCDMSQIVRVCKGKTNICKGLHFEYVD